VLLATDLSARGDRALDRAIAIAADSGAHLTIVHAFEEFAETTWSYGRHSAPSWRAPPDAIAVAKLRIRQGLRADLGDTIEKATIRIEEREPAELIEQVALSEHVDLIVTGIAREGLFDSRPVILGRTVEKLLRRVAYPILIVRNRARAPYGHILVTTDFSEASGRALQVALRFFPRQTLFLLHAFEVPYSGVISDPQRHLESFKETHAMQLAAFLESMVLPEEARRQLVPLIEFGQPAPLVREYVREQGADLVVLGTSGRGAMLEAVVGSTAKSILSSLPCDALVVREPLPYSPRDR